MLSAYRARSGTGWAWRASNTNDERTHLDEKRDQPEQAEKADDPGMSRNNGKHEKSEKIMSTQTIRSAGSETPRMRRMTPAAAQPRRSTAVTVLLAATLIGLSGCGGSSGGPATGGSSSGGSGASGSSGGGGTPASYKLSATVSGLTGSGLLLASNDGNVAVQSGAASVTLATGLASGSAFNVAVVAQPTGQTCTVANGTGTIGTADVANTVVTCADQAFALGGTISGLGSGTGLVLANGNDTLAVAAGATRFTMPAQVAYGSSYSVHVQTQPAGLACAVAGGSGTMPASSVASVTVSCTDQPFSLGGTISGLGQNTGLVLLNGTDSLAVSAGATRFAMPTAVAYGSAYDVTVQSAPNGLTCSVAQGGGTMPASNVTSVAVTCSPQSTFALGGTVAGLSAGETLVLANGSDTLSFVYGGTASFTMPAAVAVGSTYDVVVQAQPPGKTCTVASGSGTMPASPVTSVSIACSTNTYTIGGTISGLTGTGLVLLDNGADATDIAANAARFTMTTGVAYQGGYAVTIGTQPAGETCQVASGTGSGVSGNVGDISIQCAPWSTYSTSVVHSFGGAIADGANPYDTLLLGSDGNLYGTTQNGGRNNFGAAFKITPTGSLTLLHSFLLPADGGLPQAGLVEGTDGNFYGVTPSGGGGAGIFFQVTPGGTETILYAFRGGTSDGREPIGAVVQGSDGNFYGTTRYGGTADAGIAYKITPAGVETVLHSFGGTGDAAQPQSRLIQGSDGSFYGTASSGGADNYGAVFRITPAGAETVLYSFTDGADGATPTSGLLQGSDGNFYGTTLAGGLYGFGVAYKLAPEGTLTVLHSFAEVASDGGNPLGGLLLGADGNFYGLTYLGGTMDAGTIFRITPAGVETVLHSFGGAPSDGGRPEGTLIVGPDGSFYGTTSVGGPANLGTIFKVTPQ